MTIVVESDTPPSAPVVPVVDRLPATGVAGEVVLHSGTRRLYVFDGRAWTRQAVA